MSSSHVILPTPCDFPQHQQLHFTQGEAEAHREVARTHTAPAFTPRPATPRTTASSQLGPQKRGAEPGEATKEGVGGQQENQTLRGWRPQGEGLAGSNGTTRRGCLLPAGAVGLNLWPEHPAGLYLLPPGAPVIELLPVQEGGQEEAATTILLAEAQKGQEYELVLTDQASLTR